MTMRERLQACYAAYQTGDLPTAEKHYQDLCAVAGNATQGLADAHHLGALIAQKANRPDIGLTRIESAITLVPLNPEYLNTKAGLFVTAHDFPKARKAYAQSVLIKPDHLPTCRSFGQFLIHTSDPVAAIQVFETALKSAPNDKQLKTGLAIAMKDALRSQEALAIVEGLDAGLEHAYLRGQIYFQLSRSQDAITAYVRALEHPPTMIPALKNIFQIYWMRDEWNEAEILIESLKPIKDTAMLLTISRAYRDADDVKSAQKIMDDATQQCGNDPYFMAEQARIKLAMQDTEGAWDAALAALSAKPGDIALMECLADCAMASGRPDDAMNAAHGALEVLPNNQYWIAMKYTAGRAMGQNYRYYANCEDFVQAYELTPPQGYATIEAFNLVLKKTLSSLHEFTNHPLDQSLREGSQTSFDLRQIDHPVLNAFFEMLDTPIRAYMDMLGTHVRGTDSMHPLMRRNTKEYRLTGSWSVQLKTGGFHVNHVHPEGWISSAYYVDVPSEVETSEDKAGWIHFGEPPWTVKDKTGKIMGPEKYVKPKVGTLVLFPSYLWHGTIPLQENGARMTLPFDVVPA